MLTQTELNLLKNVRFKQRLANFFNINTYMVKKLLKKEENGQNTLLSSPLVKKWIADSEEFSDSLYLPETLIQDSDLLDGTKSRLKRNWANLSEIPYEKATIKDLANIENYGGCRYSVGIKTLSDIRNVCKECGVECKIQIKK